MASLRSSDLARVAEQLGREPTVEFEVVARCGVGGPDVGHPLVIRNRPVRPAGGDGGAAPYGVHLDPFPTLYWLTCPVAVKAVSRVESEGWIARLRDRARSDRAFAAALERAHRAYAEERGLLEPGAERWGGVGGTRRGVKCLHAHYAHHLAGGEDPVGGWVADHVEPVHPEAPGEERVAVVDMGTNSIRLLVADPADGGLLEVARDTVITRLGRDVDRTRRIEPRSLRLTVEVLERYARRAAALGARRTRVAATSAVRDTAEREELFRRVREVAGAEPEVLQGEREGELAFLGATRAVEAPPPSLVFDIGGGSTELILGGAGPEASVSVDVGSVRITERVGPADPPTEDDLREMDGLADRGLAEAEKAVPSGAAATLVGVAGTTTTVQALALGLDRYDPEAIHGSTLARPDAERVSAELARMTVAERAALPVMAPGREDVIVAGSRILLAILRRWVFDACVVSEADILDGLALEMLGSSGYPDGPGAATRRRAGREGAP